MASITWTIQNPKSAVPNPEGLGGRSATDKYVGDHVRQGFTGYLNDEETNLDYAQARMYKKDLGRFTGADPVGGDTANPQTLNRYLYVWNNPLNLTDPTGLDVSWEDSEKGKDGKTESQRNYEKHLDNMVNSKDPDVRTRGLKLKAEYERLNNDHSVTFHVRDEVADSSSGELSYGGEKGHLYVNIKGAGTAFGELTTVQKLAHEFKHGNQFLDGEFGFRKTESGKWVAYSLDVHDETEAMMAGFDAAPITGFQNTNNSGYRSRNTSFFGALDSAIPRGFDAVLDVMKDYSTSPYKNHSKIKSDIRNMPASEGYYGIPKKASN